MLRRLTAFYESHGISPVNFRCPSRSECAAGSPDFTEAKMSSVPPRYGMPGLPRLLFLSLDSGSGSSDPRERTAEAVRQWNVECDVAALPKNNHWYRTHQLAFELLRQFKPDLTGPRNPALLCPRQQREVLPEQVREEAGRFDPLRELPPLHSRGIGPPEPGRRRDTGWAGEDRHRPELFGPTASRSRRGQR